MPQRPRQRTTPSPVTWLPRTIAGRSSTSVLGTAEDMSVVTGGASVIVNVSLPCTRDEASGLNGYDERQCCTPRQAIA